MLFTAIGVFALAALLGILLLTYILRDKPTPKGIALIHGSIAALGIVILIFSIIYGSVRPLVSIALFVLAALGGFMLVFRDITGKSVPKWFAIGHGLTAITAFIFLLLYTFIPDFFI